MLQLQLFLLVFAVCVDTQFTWSVTLFKDTHYRGPSITLNGGMQCVPVPDDFIDKASSAKFADDNVRKYLVFWRYSGCEGSPVQIHSGSGCAQKFSVCGINDKVRAVSLCFTHNCEGIIRSFIPPPAPPAPPPVTPNWEQMIRDLMPSPPPPTPPPTTPDWEQIIRKILYSTPQPSTLPSSTFSPTTSSPTTTPAKSETMLHHLSTNVSLNVISALVVLALACALYASALKYRFLHR